MKSMRSHTKGPFRLAAILLLVSGGLTLGIAQTRYSANVVGYSDAEFVAGSNLVANPFNARNNTLSNLFAGLPSGSFFLPWDPVSRTFGPANQFSSQSGWTDGAATLSGAQGGFLWLPAPKRISFVGEPWPPTCVTFPEGESVVGFMPRLSCDLCAGVNDCLIYPPDHTIIEKWDRQGQYFRVYDFLGWELGWYPDIVTPTLAPDEAALFRSPTQFRSKYPGFFSPVSARLFKPSRDGANFVFQFAAPYAGQYSVQRSSSLVTGPWRTILSETATPTDGVITVTVPAGKDGAAFYRVDTLRLRNPSRAGSQFQFQFYAEEGVHYQVSRSAALGPGEWNPLLTIDGTGAMVTATDPAATSPTAYYRVEY
jgi:hypothetical protein